MATGRDRFYFPPPEVVDSTPVDKAATIADGINYFPQTITDSLVQGYTGNTSTGHNTSDLSTTMANVDNRITELEGGGVRFTITSSTTIDVSAYQTLKVILIGSSLSATHNVNGPRFGDIGGVAGGFISGEVSTSQLTALGYDLTAVPVTVGTAGGQSYFGPTDNFAMRTIAGRADKGDRMGADATTSGPGNGGNGGSSSYSVSHGDGGTTTVPAKPGTKGADSVLADGGAGGALQSGSAVVGTVGTNGGVATINGPFPCGGAGGGGGGPGVAGLFGITYNGGGGGHGGFPGGGPGGGGAGGGTNVGNGNIGASGARANGVMLIDAA